MDKTPSTPSTDSTPKHAYTKPVVTVLGTIPALTQSGGSRVPA